MAGSKLLRMRSLRSKLSLAAGAGLLTAAVLTALLLLVTWNSGRVVTEAQVAQDRVHTFNSLLGAARDYQNASYLAVRDTGPEAQAELSLAGQRFNDVIEEASRLKVSSLREREVRARIAAQSRAALDLYRDAEPLVAQVDRAWREKGSNAALAEVSRLIAPVKELEETLKTEIRHGDLRLRHAVRRAQDLNRVAVASSIVCLLLAVLFLFAVQWLLYARLRPGLARLEKGAQAIGSGHLDHRIGLKGCDELTALGGAFDAMAAEISRQQAQLQDVQRGLERAVAERTQELEAANAKLSETDERRRAFLADVGHELRTPLTIIRGEAQVALRTADDPTADLREAFDHILVQTNHLSQMVSDLFLIARAEAGGLSLDLQQHDLGAIIARVAADFENLAVERGGSINAVADACMLAMIDAERLHRALTALIENALQHCQPGVNIRLEAFPANGRAVLAVCDDGPGVAPDEVDRLFERFRRGASRSKGSGLGLSIVSALAEAHGGKARLEVLPEGGTRAVIELPLVKQPRIAA